MNCPSILNGVRETGRSRRKNRAWRSRKARHRAGSGSLDYVLVLGVTLPLVAFLMKTGTRIVQLAYEMVSVLVSWPFM
jgi:hypothetical protein